MPVPPPLPWEIRTRPERFMLLFASVCAFIGALLWAARLPGVALPLCLWKAVTGLPCAGCGGTRAIGLLSCGDLAGALAMNPAAIAGSFLVAVLAAYACIVLLFRVEPLRLSFFRWRMWRFVALAALAANWIYLLLAGRV